MNSSLLVLQYCYSFVFVGKTSITEDARHTQKAIDEFRKTNPRFVKQIVVVFHENRMLKDFKIALFKNNYATTSIVSSPFPLFNDHSPSPLPSPTTSLMLRRNETDPTSTLLPNQGNKIAVNVIQSNILKSTCEVLVNTTSSDFNLLGKHKPQVILCVSSVICAIF